MGPDPPLLFRPLLRFICANPLRSVSYIGGVVLYMHVYCHFLLLAGKEKLFKTPILGLPTPLHGTVQKKKLKWKDSCLVVTSSPLVDLSLVKYRQ